jgi:hypothetical protein
LPAPLPICVVCHPCRCALRPRARHESPPLPPPTMSGDKLDNPFCLPSDEEVFHLREKEREELNATRQKLKNLRVWEKTTSASRLSSTKSIRGQLAPATQELLRGSKPEGGNASSAPPVVSDHRHEKESMADFVAKKREMFLVQMALNTKRDEIAKLEEKAKLKQEALRKSELMLEEDTLHFEAFLKENDEKAHSAIRKAELETQKKNQKIQEVKKLKQAIQLVHSKMSKLKEQLDLCQQCVCRWHGVLHAVPICHHHPQLVDNAGLRPLAAVVCSLILWRRSAPFFAVPLLPACVMMTRPRQVQEVP